MNKLVELENVSKTYPNKKVLSNISLDIYENQVIAILGGNGTGKSTILQIIAGLERPSSGKVIYAEQTMKISYVPERFPKHLRFTPSEYLNYIGKISGCSSEYLNKRIPYLLHRFQLDTLNTHWIRDLSKGNVQKVGIIQAILKQPKLLILDEPISGLDLHAQQELMAVMKELKAQGTTILLTYHESTILETLVDNIYYLHNGLLSKDNLNMNDNEQTKLIVVKQLDEQIVKQWHEVIHMESRDNRLLLYVHATNSDAILARILQQQGSIEYVSTQNFDDNVTIK